jgi:hypothetical protein
VETKPSSAQSSQAAEKMARKQAKPNINMVYYKAFIAS